MRAELLLHKNLTVPATRVLVTSDETDAAWWADVRARGWRGIDHAAARTAERLGRWYPVLVDAAALARAQVLQQLTVLEGLVDANSRSREEWLEAQNELDYRMVRVRGLRARAHPS